MKLKRESLKNGEVFIWMDFAENFTCSAVEEVQSAYWNPQMVTLIQWGFISQKVLSGHNIVLLRYCEVGEWVR
jgi:hypothetical protein